MAATHGRSGVIQIGAVGVGELTEWSYEETVDATETTAMADTAKSFLGGLRDGSGSISCWWDADDAGQEDILDGLAAGTTITLNIYPSGDTGSGADYYTGSVVVNGNSVSATKDDIISATFTYRGFLTLGTVA